MWRAGSGSQSKYGTWQSMSALFCFAFLFMDVAYFWKLWFKFSDQVTSLTKQSSLPQRSCRGKMEVFQELKEVTSISPGNISVSGQEIWALFTECGKAAKMLSQTRIQEWSNIKELQTVSVVSTTHIPVSSNRGTWDKGRPESSFLWCLGWWQ